MTCRAKRRALEITGERCRLDVYSDPIKQQSTRNMCLATEYLIFFLEILGNGLTSIQKGARRVVCLDLVAGGHAMPGFLRCASSFVSELRGDSYSVHAESGVDLESA